MVRHPMATLARTGRRVLAALDRRRMQGPLRAYVEGLNDCGAIRGWAFDPRDHDRVLDVGLYLGDRLLAQTRAGRMREDVRARMDAPLHCGFEIRLSPALMGQILGAAGRLSLRSIGADGRRLGDLALPALDAAHAAMQAGGMAAMRLLLGGPVGRLAGLLADPAPDAPRPPLVPHQAMFATAPIIPGVPATAHSAYLDHARYRARRDEAFDLQGDPEGDDRYLRWYLTQYRNGQFRVPLGRQEIAHLNAPQGAMTRAMAWALADQPAMQAAMATDSAEGRLDLMFWWANIGAPQIHAEDCLVPPAMVDALCAPASDGPVPLTAFAARLHRAMPILAALPVDGAQGRGDLYLAMMAMAADRPDLLRYIPAGFVDAALDDGRFARFINALRPDTAPLAITRAAWAGAMRARQFDPDTRAFTTFDAHGNRFEAAALRADPAQPRVDVQLIGPLAKASGLGQATRLSARMLAQTGLTVRHVDFDLDNPAPEGFSDTVALGRYGPARVNLIHLNAESVPQALAFQPDVFSGAYNIGYFFWELDQQALCHYLGVELLDEIWVSTEFGATAYRPAAGHRPVTTIGMCFEDPGPIDRSAARAFVQRRFGMGPQDYICLVAFDSYSYVQRKNPVATVQAFLRAFDGVAQARLIIKTQNRDAVFDPVQIALWKQVHALVQSDPRITLVNETMQYADLLQMKAGVDCYLSLHRSEGWGFGMIEAMNLGVPVVCTGYSGNMDFCTADTAWLVDYTMTGLAPGDYIFVRPGAVWADPDPAHAAAQIRAAYDNPAERHRRAAAAQAFVRANFSQAAIARRYGARLAQILAARHEQGANHGD